MGKIGMEISERKKNMNKFPIFQHFTFNWLDLMSF